ncbi:MULTISPECIES: hypothetical protein [Niastella]|uniref:Glycosyltransferase RgtA/B/C/D-like domain-containing protein n=1 Tax=Niastella soli TaxID=2821487 RepID=A0ABS3Z358_9BACT|nr:hypothetical protein [Niastella soli]MBO9204607.1 hypothetical protein [Niastella soli]
MAFRDNIPAQAFFSWLIKSWENRILLLISMLIMAPAFAWFKRIYPLPNIFPDSYEYIQGALEKRMIDYRPIGYTKFLQFFPFITRSHFWLVTTQFILMQTSLLYMLFTIRYLLQPGKWVFIVLLVGCVLNPLMYQVSNFVSSDPLFTALTMIWFTQLLWMLVRPTTGLLLSHTVVLFLAFVVRYNAIYYPLISIGIVVFSRAPRWLKGVSAALIVVSLGYFVMYTKQQFKKITGIAQFSPFGGWQQATNALVAYSQGNNLLSVERVPAEFKEVHTLVNLNRKQLQQPQSSKDVHNMALFYLWDYRFPLRYYMNQQGEKYSINSTFIRWARMGPLYNSYGNYLIKKHIGLYFNYHILSNIEMYFTPILEFLEVYNDRKDSIMPEGVQWFNISAHPFKKTINNEIKITDYIVIAHGICTLILLLAAFGYVCLATVNNCAKAAKKTVDCSLLVLIANAGFSILASTIVLRYQAFQFILTIIFCILLSEFVIRDILHLQKLKKTKSIKETGLSERELILND